MDDSTSDLHILSTSNRATVAVMIDDLGINCCKTGLTLNWTVNSNNIISSSSRSKFDWDGCPTLAGTHWYLIQNKFGSFNQGQYEVSTNTEGRHVNYDFGNPN